MTRVLVGIPTLNGPDRLSRVLDSIRHYTDLSDVTVLVADDGSTEENLKLNKDAVHRFGCEMLVDGVRRGIAARWNQLARHAEAATVALLNDDVEVVPDWLDVLRFSVEENKHAGMVGLNCYPGVTRGQIAQHGPPLPPAADYKEAHLSDGHGSLLASCGYCFAFRREAFDEVGGFDERFFVYYEEVDFGVALRMAGYRNYMASHPTIFHLGGATNSDKKNLDAQTLMLDSRSRFLGKWKATPAELRARFLAEDAQARAEGKPMPVTREWNSSLRWLRD